MARAFHTSRHFPSPSARLQRKMPKGDATKMAGKRELMGGGSANQTSVNRHAPASGSCSQGFWEGVVCLASPRQRRTLDQSPAARVAGARGSGTRMEWEASRRNRLPGRAGRASTWREGAAVPPFPNTLASSSRRTCLTL